MKKWIKWIVLLAAFVLPAVVFAAPKDDLTVSDGNAKPGQTVFVTISLNKEVTGDTMAVSYSYDEKCLEAIPESCEWNQYGLLSDFNQSDGGVWTSTGSRKLKGDICTLAFRILPDAVFDTTQISCILVVKDGSKDKGEFQAIGTISTSEVCGHNYGEWVDAGTIGHSRTCSICENVQTQSHNWDNGVLTPDEKDPQVMWKVFTCADCGNNFSEKVSERETSTEAIERPTRPSESEKETMPRPSESTQKETPPVYTRPEPTEKSTTAHNHEHSTSAQRPSQSTEETAPPKFIDYNDPSRNQTQEETSAHAQLPTEGIVIGSEEEHLHDHTHAQESGENGNQSGEVDAPDHTITIIVILVVLISVVSFVVFYFGKK